MVFKDISESLAEKVKKQDYKEKKLHIQYCPMADNNDGAYWLSWNEEIENPYMGKKMSKCGRNKESIN